MFFDILWTIAGLAMILFGANWLTDGCSSIARRMGLSDLVVGLTVVSFGTSAPEFVISMMSACKGAAPLAVGNVVGSNIFNILAIIGVTALVSPLAIGKGTLVNEIPLMVLSSAVLLVLGNGVLLDNAPFAVVSRSSGILLLFFFIIFLWYTVSRAMSDKATAGAAPEENKAPGMPIFKAILLTLAGLGLLIYGGDRFVAGASGLARSMGISDAIVGLTIAAAGTSLPELAASVAAALKGRAGMAVGNVIGSNIFNAFFVLGSAAVATPLTFGTIGNLDLLTLMVASLLFWIFGWFIGNRVITRAEGGVLTLCYIAYITVLVIRA